MKAMTLTSLVLAIAGLLQAPGVPDANAPPGMIEIPNTPPPPPPTATATTTRAWRPPMGFDVQGGYYCLATMRDGCFGSVRGGFELGVVEIHVGALFAPLAPEGYGILDGRDEDSSGSTGLRIGFEAGSPFMAVSRRVAIAARGGLDVNALWEPSGRYFGTEANLTANGTIRVLLARGFSFLGHAGVGIGFGGLVIDSSVGFQFAR
jgi:hypothetical protein